MFLMTVAPGGLKMKRSSIPPNEPETKFGRGTWVVSGDSMEAKYSTLPALAEALSFQMERTVLDRTDVSGLFDFRLRWTPENRAEAGTDNGSGDAPPAIVQAVKEQLGLKMTADKTPVPTVVVDKIVQPEEN